MQYRTIRVNEANFLCPTILLSSSPLVWGRNFRYLTKEFVIITSLRSFYIQQFEVLLHNLPHLHFPRTTSGDPLLCQNANP